MEKLSLEALPLYDQGSLQVLVNQALHDAYKDLDDRAELSAARKVTMEISLKPLHVRGELEEVECEIQVGLSLPKKAARTNTLAPSKKLGGLGFEPDTRHAKFAPGQKTFPVNGDDE